jgi:GAF domain-containing protein
LVGTSTIDEITSGLARAVSDSFGATAAAVYLASGEESQLVISATHGMDEDTVFPGKICSLKPAHRPGFHNGHTSRAYVSGEVQVVPELFSDVEFLPWRMVAQNEGIVVSVPIPYQGETLGVMNIFVAGVKSIPDSRIRLLEATAAAVSPAIENARLRSGERPGLRIVA